MLKYPHIIESWVCILKKFVKIFLLSLNAFVSFGMCSMTKVGHVIKPCHAGNFCRQSFPVSSYWFAFITIYYICSLFHTVSGQLPPRKIASQIIAPWMIVPRIIASRTIVHEVNCPQGILPFGQLPPRKISPGKLPTCHEISSKIIVPTLANSPQRELWVNWGKLGIVYHTVL